MREHDGIAATRFAAPEYAYRKLLGLSAKHRPILLTFSCKWALDGIVWLRVVILEAVLGNHAMLIRELLADFRRKFGHFLR